MADAPYVHQPFPRAMHHASKPSIIVEDPADQAARTRPEDGWFETPGEAKAFADAHAPAVDDQPMQEEAKSTARRVLDQAEEAAGSIVERAKVAAQKIMDDAIAAAQKAADDAAARIAAASEAKGKK